MQRIEFQSAEVFTKSGTSNRTGKAYNLREQEAFLHMGSGYPIKCRITLGQDQAPYAPGVYEMRTPLSVGKFDSLQANRDLGLVQVSKPAAKAV
jgi:hypothetical protein